MAENERDTTSPVSQKYLNTERQKKLRKEWYLVKKKKFLFLVDHAAGVRCTGVLYGAGDFVYSADEEPEPVSGNDGGNSEGGCWLFSQGPAANPARRAACSR